MIGHQGRLAWKYLTIPLAVLGLQIANVNSVQAEEIQAIPGEYIVKLKPSIGLKSLQQISQSLDTKVKEQISENLVLVKRPMVENSNFVLNTLLTNPAVEYAEPNYRVFINKTPNDPDLEKLWGLKNTGQKDPKGQQGVAGFDVDAEKAWDVETGSEKMLVAVIDTGLNYNHPDLAANSWTNEAEAKGKAGVDDDNNGYVDDIHGYDFVNNDGDPLDDHGHGSHCSGTIGARGDDGKGIVGVAWNVRIAGVKFLSASGGGSTADAVKSIDYAVKIGAKILSNSWGGGGASQALQEAIERSHQAGAIFIAAAGNESNNNDSSPTYPANYNVPNIVTVAAIDNTSKIASFSNYGKRTVHVAAPGVNVYSSIAEDGKYDTWSGTSMATPHVSGVAALVWSHEPKLTNIELKERMMNTVKPIPSLKSKVASGGLVSAYNALMNIQPPPDPNDPAKWATHAVSVSTPHPYKEKSALTYNVSVPKAKEISLYFDKFETEGGYDFVKIYDKSGTLVESLSGNNTGSFSAIIKGDSAKIEFSSDPSVNGYGFDITKAAWR